MTGPIAWMTKNSVAANLLMIVVVIAGLIGISSIKQEVFPDFDMDMVLVTVPYPGASPHEVEQGIVLAIEESVRGLEGVKRLSSRSGEGSAVISIDVLLDSDPEEVLGNVKNAVDRITTFPQETERPQVSLVIMKKLVVSLVLSGDVELQSLHKIAEKARSELLNVDGISQVEIEGIPPLEISIEIPRETLEAQDLSLTDISRAVKMASLELPAGSVKTDAGEVMVRVADRRLSGAEFEDIIVQSSRDGAELRLGDIANITDGYAETDEASFFNGKPAVRVVLYRVGDETPTGVSAALTEYLEATELPPSVSGFVWDDASVRLQGRMDLLLKNGAMGFVLVVVILTLFLRLKLALWVSLGLPISFLATFMMMPVVDLSINMISLFAFMVTLGMVVDDAIVVGENIYSKLQEGLEPMEAAIEGTREMAMPVTFAILTSMAAFAPLLFVPGVMGKIFMVIPMVVIIVLGASLVESFFILPAHLAHSRSGFKGTFMRKLDGVSIRVGGWLERFTKNRYQPALRIIIRNRALWLSSMGALLIIVVSLVVSGRIPFLFFPSIEGDVISLTATLPYGTPVKETDRVRLIMEDALDKTAEEVGREYLLGSFTHLGKGAASRFGGRETGGHVVTVEVALVSSDDRDFTSKDFSGIWSNIVPPLPEVESLVYSSSVGPGAGSAAQVQLSHSNADVLREASADLTEQFTTFPQLYNIKNAYTSGKTQMDFTMLPAASALGLTANGIALELRSSFFGSEALREQRGRDELKVMVRLPKNQRVSEADIEAIQIRTPSGGRVPLNYVAKVKRSLSPVSIDREDGKRVVDVSGELRPEEKSSKKVLASITAETLPALKAKYPGLEAEVIGMQREQQESFAALGGNFLIALFVIYALLAIPFKSYTQPAIIMSVIPFGFVGAVFGHVLLGQTMTIMSVFGIVALSGVVVNDSLVLIDTTNKFRAQGFSATEAIVAGASRRLRPILLTSLTTFFGLLPMIFETSVQAAFLIPMAVSLGFGILFATVIVLLMVPALYILLEDVQDMIHGAF